MREGASQRQSQLQATSLQRSAAALAPNASPAVGDLNPWSTHQLIDGVAAATGVALGARRAPAAGQLLVVLGATHGSVAVGAGAAARRLFCVVLLRAVAGRGGAEHCAGSGSGCPGALSIAYCREAACGLPWARKAGRRSSVAAAAGGRRHVSSVPRPSALAAPEAPTRSPSRGAWAPGMAEPGSGGDRGAAGVRRAPLQAARGPRVGGLTACAAKHARPSCRARKRHKASVAGPVHAFMSTATICRVQGPSRWVLLLLGARAPSHRRVVRAGGRTTAAS
jgi:hypothetical protein